MTVMIMIIIIIIIRNHVGVSKFWRLQKEIDRELIASRILSEKNISADELSTRDK